MIQCLDPESFYTFIEIMKGIAVFNPDGTVTVGPVLWVQTDFFWCYRGLEV